MPNVIAMKRPEPAPEPFEAFWKAYPRRIGKGAARKAFDKAIKTTTLDVMIAAIDLYIRHKPDWQEFCHAATWLNQERWEDDWTTPQPKANGTRHAPAFFDTPEPVRKKTPEELAKAAEMARRTKALIAGVARGATIR